MGSPRRIAVVGGGWAGLAAAVEATSRGHAVTLIEMAPQLGGRARSLAAEAGHARLDNGQHILIGAYVATLALMRRVGVDPDTVLLRMPLTLVDASGQGLRLGRGPVLLAFTRAVWAMGHWRWRERLALSNAALGWLLKGFRCDDRWTVALLTQSLPERVRREFIDPLCVAALNTPARDASAAVFLRVLRDALFAGPGSSDLLVPRRPLAELLPEPAAAWLKANGADLRLGRRAQSLSHRPDGRAGWSLDDEPFDQVVLACSASEAARLTATIAPDWSQRAAAFGYEPIITAYIQADGARLAAPMVALPEGPMAPAQFAFDHGALGAQPGRFAYVISGAATWVERGLDTTAAAALAQARASLRDVAPEQVRLIKLVAEKRATFLCLPGLQRPPTHIAPALTAAGDHIDGPYPATLEGAVRSGLAAVVG
ncbi:hydroxysqualene dehydroxylase HpnE [Sphaerotilus mobilis]|uniref:Squalene-associated FAD-dependent desaturase n=1 Tax=Sphaerotilus mobilis TaxID=47994 RepID=A0A4V2EWS8_9BURK|nr:hydroxysqualene dehydroxylase HpnE [Sphaerotilus mobilis]RZS57040.1 squalene-associated FAD-dependent desaturase [Sphaerotilus mobilis]